MVHSATIGRLPRGLAHARPLRRHHSRHHPASASHGCGDPHRDAAVGATGRGSADSLRRQPGRPLRRHGILQRHHLAHRHGLPHLARIHQDRAGTAHLAVLRLEVRQEDARCLLRAGLRRPRYGTRHPVRNRTRRRHHGSHHEVGGRGIRFPARTHRPPRGSVPFPSTWVR